MNAYPCLIEASTLRSDPTIVVVDCRFSLADPHWGARAYREGHLPGARFADLDRDLSGPRGADTGRHPLPDPAALARRLGRWGVGADTRVAVYDDAGGAFAGRLWWLLRWLGHRQAALLDGGLPAWLADGGTLSAEPPSPRPAGFPARPDRDAWLSAAQLTDGLADGTVLAIDARAAPRFRGELEPIDPVAGHIPGAINLPFQDNLVAAGERAGRFHSPERLRQRFLAAIGERSPRQIAHSCGSGVNACHNLLAMEIAGLCGSRLYAGSWSEWIRDPRRPIARGD